MAQKSSYAVIEDFDENENTENTYLLSNKPNDTNLTFLDHIKRCFRRDSNTVEEHLGEDEEVHLSREKEEVVREGIHTFSLLVVAVIAIGVALIYLSFVLVPLVLAWFFVYIFQPFINYMVGKKAILPGIRVRLPRFIAVIICVIVVLGILCLMGLAIYLSVLEITKNSDKYMEHLAVMYNDILIWAEENGLEEQFSNLLPEIQLGDIVLELIADLYELVPQGILCLLFTMYMLLDYNEKKEKSDLERLIDGQIRKYIIIKTIISLAVGVIIGFILYLFSVDMWLLFGLLTFFLNFIPNVGAMVAALLPVPVAILDPNQNWLDITLIFLIPVTVHFCVGNFVEPKVMGKSFEMSAVAVLVALAFWGAVWGLVGAFMSVPITVVLHLWLRTVPHPMAKFMAQLLVGDFRLFSVAEKLKNLEEEDHVEIKQV